MTLKGPLARVTTSGCFHNKITVSGAPSGGLGVFDINFCDRKESICHGSHPRHSIGDHMNTLRKAAVLVAALGSLGMLAAGTAQAHDGGHEKGGDQFKIGQSSNCKSHDLNLDVLGQVGILNGALGNALNGEGNPGAQSTHLGSSMGCNNSAL
jgi:hypothetical protein